MIHRDIKPANIFLFGKNASSMAKIGDFGLAKVVDYSVLCANTWAGSPFYMTPEQLHGQQYTDKADSWGIGVVLYEMLTGGEHPFPATNLGELAMKVLNYNYLPLPPNLSNETKQLISVLLSKNSTERPSIQQVLKIPFIKKQISIIVDEARFGE